MSFFLFLGASWRDSERLSAGIMEVVIREWQVAVSKTVASLSFSGLSLGVELAARICILRRQVKFIIAHVRREIQLSLIVWST